MDPITMLMLAGAGANLAGSIINKPKKQELDINGILARLGDRENRYVNRVVGQGASVLGQNLAASGIHGGAAAQALGALEAPIRSDSLGRIQGAEAELRKAQSELDSQYKTQKSDWMSSIFSDLGNAAGAGAANIMQNRQLDKMGEMDKDMLERLRSFFSSDLRPATSIAASSQAPRMTGMNAQSPFDYRWFLDSIDNTPR